MAKLAICECESCGWMDECEIRDRCGNCGETMKFFHSDATTNLDFGQALTAMKEGKMVERDNVRSMVFMIKPAQGGGVTISATDGDRWWSAVIGNTSILATDWLIVEEVGE